MKDKNNLATMDYESEYHRLRELNEQLKMKICDIEYRCGNKERECEILKAQLDMVYLIFGNGR